ncbi:alpha/beta hydrolase [Microbacterium paludicola]|uniref:Alpha/beta hydrolase n=2 Tax=Microbacterium paludicola TaxID=300019 RepID=A0A4Y9FVT0_9MICO|nr:alpha/beta hydrolase [Microbacterium paludicola]TFU33360.1 alpha/beta hydrolase [Microbacterium paludicola]
MMRAQVRLPRWLIRIAVRMLRVPTSATVSVTKDRAGSTGVRVYTPTGARSGAGLLWIHGGGLLFGDAKQDEALCLSTAERLGLVIVSANYRFAPEHPFPAAHEDVLSTWRWLIAHAAELGVDPERVVVGGESAGAGLAAALVQRIHDEGGVQPCGQWLFAPMLDDRTAARRELDAEQHFVWDNGRNREGWAGYLGAEPGAATVPDYAVPARRTDLSGLPPAFLTWGDIELFAGEDLAYAEALRAAGVSVTTDVVEGAPHGFENWAKDAPVARALVARAQEWLRGVTAPA